MLTVSIQGEGNVKMIFKVGDRVRVVDEGKVRSDIYLEETALDIIKKSRYKGEVTKIVDDVYFVGFKNDLGWVTQGYKANELKGDE